MDTLETISLFPAQQEENGAGKESNPALLSFPFGVPSSSSSVSRVQAFVKRGKRRRILLEEERGGVRFQARDFGSSGDNRDLSCFLVGVLDECSGMLQVHRGGHVFCMEREEDEESSILSTVMSSSQRRQSLTDTFGSKKKKRALRAAESNIISSENIIAADTISERLTDSVLSNSPEEKEKSVSAPGKSAMDIHRQTMLPTFDSSATVLKDAYPIGVAGGVAPHGIIEILQSWIDEKNAEEIDWPLKFGSDSSSLAIIKSTYNECVATAKDKKYKKKLTLLLLCDALIRMGIALSETQKPIDKDVLYETLWHPPAQLFRYMTDKFAVFRKKMGKNTFVSSKSLLDQLFMHAIILLLHLNGGKFSLSTLIADANIGSARTTALAKEVGCVMSYDTNAEIAKSSRSVTAQITLPLKFPEHRKPKKKS